jgi:hypothetical protein
MLRHEASVVSAIKNVTNSSAVTTMLNKEQCVQVSKLRGRAAIWKQVKPNSSNAAKYTKKINK